MSHLDYRAAEELRRQAEAHMAAAREAAAAAERARQQAEALRTQKTGG